MGANPESVMLLFLSAVPVVLASVFYLFFVVASLALARSRV